MVGLVPPGLGPPSTRLTAVNVKVWFGGEPREHYEAQLLRDGTLEVGFHSEHRSAERNQAVLDALVARERTWRRHLPGAVAGPFAGAPTGPWRRLSEVGPGPRPMDVDAALDIADRLAVYVAALEPLRA